MIRASYAEMQSAAEEITKASEEYRSNVDSLYQIVDELVNKGVATMKILNTDSVWFGVTYKDDKPGVVKALKELVEKGVYKEGLY